MYFSILLKSVGSHLKLTVRLIVLFTSGIDKLNFPNWTPHRQKFIHYYGEEDWALMNTTATNILIFKLKREAIHPKITL